MMNLSNILNQENLRMKRIVSVVLLLVAVSCISLAQTPLTLEKAVQIAVKGNTDVVQAQNALESSESDIQSAYGNLYPTVGVSGDWSQTTSQSKFAGGVELPGSGVSSTSKYYSLSLGANMTLFDGFANYAGIKQAKAGKIAATNKLSHTEKFAMYQTHLLFLNVMRMYKLLQVNEDNLKRSQQQLTRIDEANKVGSVALADVYRQKVQVGSDELSLIQGQNNYDQAQADLFAFLAINNPKEYSIDFSGVSTDIDTSEFAVMDNKYSDFERLSKDALSNRGDYLSAMQSVAIADAGIEAAKSGNLPSLTANASYGYSNSELSRVFDNNSLNLGLTIRYSIFNGFQTQSGIEKASINKKNSEEQLNQTQRQIRVELQKTLLEFQTTQKQIVVTKTSVESAEMDRRIADEKYNLGAGTLLDVLIAQANYTTAMNNKVNASIGYLLAKKKLEYTLGTISQ